jgi:hypothetical protein
MRKTELVAHAVSFDVDGCLLPADSKQIANSPLNSNPVSQHNRELLSAIKKQNKHAFSTCIGLIGSSRQSQQINECNRINLSKNSNEDPTSCFLPLKHIVEQDLDSTFSPFLLADAYGENADGHAFQRAIQEAKNEDAYHQNFLFDDKKSSLLYTQIHLTANNLRNCDFARLSFIPTAATLATLPIKSNAAYLICREGHTEKFFYVNKIEGVIKELKKPDNKVFGSFDGEIKNEGSACFVIPCKGIPPVDFVQGVTLSYKNLKLIGLETDHFHTKKDYPLVFDYYEDRRDILQTLQDLYTNNKYLIPKNVIMRLYLHNGNTPDHIPRYYSAIRGTGRIDLFAKKTLLELAKEVLSKGENEDIKDEDYAKNINNNFHLLMQSKIGKAIFKKRTLAKPTVSIKEN